MELESDTAGVVDLYGIAAQVPGRRSFGGFNARVQEEWQASHKFYKTGHKPKKLSDDELLRRFSNKKKSPKKRGNKTSLSGGGQSKRTKF